MCTVFRRKCWIIHNSLTFRVRRYVVIATKRAPIANPPSSAQIEGIPYHSPSYIRVHAVVLECGNGQTDRHTDGRDHYTFLLGYALREV